MELKRTCVIQSLRSNYSIDLELIRTFLLLLWRWTIEYVWSFKTDYFIYEMSRVWKFRTHKLINDFGWHNPVDKKVRPRTWIHVCVCDSSLRSKYWFYLTVNKKKSWKEPCVLFWPYLRHLGVTAVWIHGRLIWIERKEEPRKWTYITH